MPENRKILVEVLEGGEIIVSANFDNYGGRHEMRGHRVFDRTNRAVLEVEQLLECSGYEPGQMYGDGSVPMKPHISRHADGDDIPF